MNAADIIRAIEALPHEERCKVARYLRLIGDDIAEPRSMDPAFAEVVAARVFTEHQELFKRIAD